MEERDEVEAYGRTELQKAHPKFLRVAEYGFGPCCCTEVAKVSDIATLRLGLGTIMAMNALSWLHNGKRR